MGNFIKRLFTWWNGATLGTLLQIRRFGEKVGEDEYGNTYFQSSEKLSYDGRPRRWVTYKGYADASRIPAEWHGWLHHTDDDVPTEADTRDYAWQKPHHPNLTGTVHAYTPKGSLARGADSSAVTDSYEAWTPDA